MKSLAIFCLVLVTLLAGCASVKVVETWSRPTAKVQYAKILVLGIGNDETKRKLYEDIVVDELKRQLVNATAGHTIIPDLGKTDRDRVVAAVHGGGFDAVLVTRVISLGSSTVTQQGATGYVYGVSPATTYGDFLKATLQSNLYDVRSEELVWSTTFKTFDADREARVSREMGKYFYEALRKEGFL